MNIKPKHITKWVLIGVSFAILLLIIARISLRSNIVHEKIKAVIKSEALEQLDAEVTIDQLYGDAWHNLTVEGITAIKDSSSLTISSVNLRYSFWSLIKQDPYFYAISLDDVHGEIDVYDFGSSTEPAKASKEKKLALTIDSLSVTRSSFKFELQDILPDSSLIISELNALSSLKMSEENEFTLYSLSFQIIEGSLPEPISIKSSASYQNELVTLDQIVLETGKSMISSTISANVGDSTLSGELEAIPIQLKDVEPLLNMSLAEEELIISVKATGNKDSIKVEVNMDHPFAPELFGSMSLQRGESPTISRFGLTGAGLDLGAFTNDSIPIKTSDFSISLNGTLNRDLTNSDLIWGYTFTEIQASSYYIDRFIGSGTVTGDTLIGYVAVNPHFESSISVYPKIYGLVSEKPTWNINVIFKELNVQDWTTLAPHETELYGGIALSGIGFSLFEEEIKYSASLTSVPKIVGYDFDRNTIPVFGAKNRIGQQEFDNARLSGTFNQEYIEGNGSLTLLDSSVEYEIQINEYQSDAPFIQFLVNSTAFNLSEINGFENFPSDMMFEIEGNGAGKSIESAEISSSISIQNSTLNNAQIQLFEADLDVSKGILVISNGILDSEIADGEISGIRNITNFSDPNNRFDLDLTVKDPQFLSGLTDFKEIEGNGFIKGAITEDQLGRLQGDFQLELNQIRIDSLFKANEIRGDAGFILTDSKQFESSLEIEQPIIQGVNFQDFNLIAKGWSTEDSLYSEFNANIIGSERGRLEQIGTLYSDLNTNTTDVRFTKFNFISNESSLELQKPFNVRIFEQGIGTDTLSLESEVGAFLNFGIPFMYQEEQEAFFEGQNFNFGLIQEIIFGERLVDGILSGAFEYERVGEAVSGNGDILLEEVNYRDMMVDSTMITYTIRDEELVINGSIFWEGEEKVNGYAKVPFVFDEDLLDEEFFERTVNGNINIQPTSLNRFNSLLAGVGITNTTGIFSFNGSMSGSAGKPFFQGNVMMDQPVLSGVQLDNISGNFEYNNTTSEFDAIGEIFSQSRRVGEISIQYPFGFDFKTFEPIIMAEKDSLNIQLFSDDLDLAIFNDFVDPNYLTNLSGVLDAEVTIQGTNSNLSPNGRILLQDGRAYIPNLGLSLYDVQSNALINEEELDIQLITARSGIGTFSLEGEVSLQGIQPKEVNILASAEQFEISNTEDLKMVVDVNGYLTGEAIRPKLEGNIQMVNGFIYLDDFGDNLVEEVVLEGEEQSSFAPYDSISMDMIFQISDNFFVRSRDILDLEIELNGDLDVFKETGEELKLFGGLGSSEGYVRPLRKQFDLESAELIFIGDAENPELDVRANYTPPTRQKGEVVEIFYVVQGTTSEPVFRFESNPVMEQGDIICYVLFNNVCDESWQSTFAEASSGNVAVNALTDVLLDQIEGVATSQLGVDVVQIDNTGANGATSIRTGWYLNQRTFFSIINEITSSTPKTLFLLEYILDENWDLVVTQGDDSRQGIEIRFQHDY